MHDTGQCTCAGLGRARTRPKHSMSIMIKQRETLDHPLAKCLVYASCMRRTHRFLSMDRIFREQLRAAGYEIIGLISDEGRGIVGSGVGSAAAVGGPRRSIGRHTSGRAAIRYYCDARQAHTIILLSYR